MAKSSVPTETSEPCLTYHILASSPPIISRLVADTGTTGHFLESSASYTNKLITHLGISILLPNHGMMKSTHTAQLSLPFLPPEACKVHVFPCLALGLLISIGQLCDYGCTATFTATTVIVSLGGNQVCSRTRSHATQHLWCLDAAQSSQVPLMPVNNDRETISGDVADAVIPTATSRECITFVHASCFSPSPSTLIMAIDAGRMVGFPWLTS